MDAADEETLLKGGRIASQGVTYVRTVPVGGLRLCAATGTTQARQPDRPIDLPLIPDTVTPLASQLAPVLFAAQTSPPPVVLLSPEGWGARPAMVWRAADLRLMSSCRRSRGSAGIAGFPTDRLLERRAGPSLGRSCRRHGRGAKLALGPNKRIFREGQTSAFDDPAVRRWLRVDLAREQDGKLLAPITSWVKVRPPVTAADSIAALNTDRASMVCEVADNDSVRPSADFNTGHRTRSGQATFIA